MDHSCYRCGTGIEENAAFCSSCGAPQIKVAIEIPGPVPVEPETVGDVVELSQISPQTFQPSDRIQWKSFWRIALPLAVMGGVSFPLIGPPGIVIFLAGAVMSVLRYRRYHPGPLVASQGARLGAFTGLLSFIVVFMIDAFRVFRDPGDLHRQMMLAMQQNTQNMDPGSQQFVEFLATSQGFAFILICGSLIFLGVFLALASSAGALTVTFSGSKRK